MPRLPFYERARRRLDSAARYLLATQARPGTDATGQAEAVVEALEDLRAWADAQHLAEAEAAIEQAVDALHEEIRQKQAPPDGPRPKPARAPAAAA
jgi:hypothetical protein